MKHWHEKLMAIFEADTTDLRELALLAGGNPKYFYRGANLNGVDVRGQDLRGMEFTDLRSSGIIANSATTFDPSYDRVFVEAQVADSIKRIKTCGRHEQRIAVLFDEMMKFPGTAVPLINRYKGKAALEQEVSNFLTQNLVGTLAIDESIYRAVARAVLWTTKRVFPQNRGVLYLYLALHLAQYSELRNLIQGRLNSTRSMYVEVLRRDIQEYLSRFK
jgi:hypothetical protein